MSTCSHELQEYFAAETAAERRRVKLELELCDACLQEISELETTEESLRNMHQRVGDAAWQEVARKRAMEVSQTPQYTPRRRSWRTYGLQVAAACVIFLCGMWSAQWTPPPLQATGAISSADVVTAGFDLYVEKSRNLLLGVSALDQSCSDYTNVNVEDFRKASGQLVSELLVLQESLQSHSLDLNTAEVELLGKIEEILLHLHSLENDALPDQARPLSESAQEIVCMVASMQTGN